MTDGIKVLIVVLIVWIGIFFYLVKLDREITKLKKTRKE
jgi:CcmD family protein